jgi:hypothetical protein
LKTKAREGARIWKELNSSVGKKKLDFIYYMISSGHTLFADAARAYDAGTYLGTVLLCRATLECTFFLYLTREWNEFGALKVERPMRLDGKVRDPDFAELANAVNERVRFSTREMKAIGRIQEHGNDVAHVASRLDKESLRILEEVERIQKGVYEKRMNKRETRRAYEKVNKRLIFFPTQESALQDLRDTARVLRRTWQKIPYPAWTRSIPKKLWKSRLGP